MPGPISDTYDGPSDEKPKIPAWAGLPTELRAFLAMLRRSNLGFGTRHDYNPAGTAVMVEHPHEKDSGFHVTEWAFDADGKLTGVELYEGEVY